MTKTFEELEAKVERLAELVRSYPVGAEVNTRFANINSRLDALEGFARSGDFQGKPDRVWDQQAGDSAANGGELEGKSLAVRVRALEVLLSGDEARRQEWAHYKKLGVTPNIPEPPIGKLERIDDAIAHLGAMFKDRLSELTRKVDATDDRHLLMQRLAAFFKPMLDNAKPFEVAADRDYVDTAVARLSSALRSEFSSSMLFAQSFLRWFPIEEALDYSQDNPDTREYRMAAFRANAIAEQLHQAAQRVKKLWKKRARK